jgi:hypothetical protein
VYRPYLQPLYLVNAYHFYSPEPGPPNLMWFHIRYADNSTRWVKLPDRDEFPTKQQYQRRIALCETFNSPPSSPAHFEAAWITRRTAGLTANPGPVPVHPGVLPQLQYRPVESTRQYLAASYIRHVAGTYKSTKNPESPVTRIKMYRVIHYWMDARILAAGYDPADPTYYAPFYQGEYDPQGNLLSQLPIFEADGALRNRNTADPYLYWLIPIIYTHGGKPDGAPFLPQANVPPPPAGQVGVVDYTEIHANLP